MKKSECAVLIVFVAAVLLGHGCTSDDDRHETFDLDGDTFTEKFTCNKTFTGQPTTCPDVNQVDRLEFQRVGFRSYEVRNDPDTGFVIEGTLIGVTFNWTATSTSGYTEFGTWTFSSGGGSFSGPSHYTADDDSYSGDCNTNGDRGLSIPADPPSPTGCP